MAQAYTLVGPAVRKVKVSGLSYSTDKIYSAKNSDKSVQLDKSIRWIKMLYLSDKLI